ncbi:MAG: hypothetical protein IKF52_00175 [Clostridia bacterium]|nr:hypothetical protein [Clostridia bacterium]
MKEEYRKALVEVEAILENTDEELVKKIPEKFMNYVRENKAKDYSFAIDKNKGLLEQDISEETKAILSLIYRDYFCDENERQELIRQEKEEQIKEEEEKRKRYNPDDLFKKEENETKSNVENEVKQEDTVALVKYENLKWYQKIYQKILKIFKIK